MNPTGTGTKLLGTEMTAMMQMKTDMMERFAKHDEANKAFNERFNVIFVALTPLTATDGEHTRGVFFFLLWHMELVRRSINKSLSCRMQC